MPRPTVLFVIALLGVRSIRALNLGLSYFVYANVKTMVEYRRDLRQSQNYTLATVLRFAL